LREGHAARLLRREPACPGDSPPPASGTFLDGRSGLMSESDAAVGLGSIGDLDMLTRRAMRL
jgi:hypothetical protein